MTTWTDSDAVKLREFLGGCPHFLKTLSDRKPKIEGNTVEAAGLSGKQNDGAQKMIEVIEQLAEGQDTGEKSPYVT